MAFLKLLSSNTLSELISKWNTNADSYDVHETKPATTTEFGHIKVGTNLTIDGEGKLNAEAGGASSADQVTYNNTTSGMTATNVQAAIDEHQAEKASIVDLGHVRVDNQTILISENGVISTVPFEPIASIYYWLGNENTLVTGDWVEGYNNITGGSTKTLTKEVDHLKIGLTSGSIGSGNISASTFVTHDLVDLTNISTLKVEWDCTSSITNFAYLGLQVVSDKSHNRTTFVASLMYDFVVPFSKRVNELDVSALSGSYYLRIYHQAENGRAQTQKTYRVWGE